MVDDQVLTLGRGGKQRTADGVGGIPSHLGRIAVGQHPPLGVEDHGVAQIGVTAQRGDYLLQPSHVVGQNPTAAGGGQGIDQPRRLLLGQIQQKVALPLDQIEHEDRHEQSVNQCYPQDELAPDRVGPEADDGGGQVGHQGACGGRMSAVKRVMKSRTGA